MEHVITALEGLASGIAVGLVVMWIAYKLARRGPPGG